LEFLLKPELQAGQRSVLFPTRDDDLVFLDRFRQELAPSFSLVMPETSALRTCLNKWETYLCANRAGVDAPKCWMIEDENDLRQAAAAVKYPCVLKPVSSHHWRQGNNWEIVGERKAIAVSLEQELLTQYKAIERADKRAILQELVMGSDDCLVTTACYLGQGARWIGAFNTQKLVQVPQGFGTGCIVQVITRPELFEPTSRLLQSMDFTGIAEVEYKWDAASGKYKLIEVNPRPWDQHRLGNACGVDLIYMAYCERAGLPMPAPGDSNTGWKWIADDTLTVTAVRMLWRRDPDLSKLIGHARGKRIYAIWSLLDPLPFIAFCFSFVGKLWRAAIRLVALDVLVPKGHSRKKELMYENRAE
jgi:predicted ATP-grasp superfamily ATP-dependent carboligase